ncbi:MAG: alpha-amylase family glycosyl hydrolase [Syntrophothermus sp.]
MHHWIKDSVFYHIYPLGFCNAPHTNDFTSQPEERLNYLYEWAGHLSYLGVNALYLGPVFESDSHGYDTADYFRIDRRLGTNQSFAALTRFLKEKGIRVVLDGVFNHVGRNFHGFRDLQEKGQDSQFRRWFSGVDFSRRSPMGDPFTYDTWNGHYSLVKLNLSNPEVRHHIFSAVESWIREYDIDGLRLDAADCLDFSFMRELSEHCRKIKKDFWMMGEVIHGDYSRYIREGGLDSVTNYECSKGLYSSHNDVNYFEIAHSLTRQFGSGGIYRDMTLYSFADNHDVDRIASTLKDRAHLLPLHILLFTMPGIPSLYYGSEWGLQGKKSNGSDAALRPFIELHGINAHPPVPGLIVNISKLSEIRRNSEALKTGSYQQLHVSSSLFAFARQSQGEYIIMAVNSSAEEKPLELQLPFSHGVLTDILNSQKQFHINNGKCIIDIPPKSGVILKMN